ncbi:hypothetical protein Vretimale_2731 [Volvox reticuliferus]|uniref:Uncharacterized protein n=1 Tax=Volvox reticuliferus TaxID=1737510 RepID=A0A8J4DBZ4_9CHLO|nr:hypothetical protein Vretimale_2731 [Volvox reticuliferus]
MGCLGQPDGCTVVPGLPEEQYYFTLVTSFGGGLVAGFVSKLEPQGEREVNGNEEALNAFGLMPQLAVHLLLHPRRFCPAAVGVATNIRSAVGQPVYQLRAGTCSQSHQR